MLEIIMKSYNRSCQIVRHNTQVNVNVWWIAKTKDIFKNIFFSNFLFNIKPNLTCYLYKNTDVDERLLLPSKILCGPSSSY